MSAPLPPSRPSPGDMIVMADYTHNKHRTGWVNDDLTVEWEPWVEGQANE